jgi:hypothetical protein
MVVQPEKFASEHEGRIGDVAVYSQEPNYTRWRLCKMSLAVRGIDAVIKWNSEGSFHKEDELRDLKADYVLANLPFNISDWGGDRLREDARWIFGVPPASNATSPGFNTSRITLRRPARQAWFSRVGSHQRHPEQKFPLTWWEICAAGGRLKGSGAADLTLLTHGTCSTTADIGLRDRPLLNSLPNDREREGKEQGGNPI